MIPVVSLMEAMDVTLYRVGIWIKGLTLQWLKTYKSRICGYIFYGKHALSVSSFAHERRV